MEPHEDTRGAGSALLAGRVDDPRVGSDSMNIEQVIATFARQGGRRGRTASPGSKDYERARSLDFQLCSCSERDPDRSYPDYIAGTSRGAFLYVGVDPRTMTISCGPKGYHSSYGHGTPPCI